jgi:chaperone modulatory protein CbpM
MNIETEVLWLDEHRVVSLRELCEMSGLGESELLELVHSGAIAATGTSSADYRFSARVITVARTACRLRNDFELDTRGLSVALRLLERVHELEAEVTSLRVQIPR